MAEKHLYSATQLFQVSPNSQQMNAKLKKKALCSMHAYQNKNQQFTSHYTTNKVIKRTHKVARRILVKRIESCRSSYLLGPGVGRVLARRVLARRVLPGWVLGSSVLTWWVLSSSVLTWRVLWPGVLPGWVLPRWVLCSGRVVSVSSSSRSRVSVVTTVCWHTVRHVVGRLVTYAWEILSIYN